MRIKRIDKVEVLRPRVVASSKETRGGACLANAPSPKALRINCSWLHRLLAPTLASRISAARKARYTAGIAATSFLFSLSSVSLAQSAGPTVGGCPVFPADSIWNTPVDRLPVDPHSRQYVASIAASGVLHPDFGSGVIDGGPIGIPFTVVPASQSRVAILFRGFGDEASAGEESDPGPYPIPHGTAIEGGAQSQDDRHVIVVQQGSCTLYELYKAVPNADGGWSTVSAARFDLKSHKLRPDGWTSADAAGLPIFPGLVRAEEIAAGQIRHALRFTAPQTRQQYRWPARHFASRSSDQALPPLGQRFRLRADFDVSAFAPTNRIILRALQKYGMMLADNGSPWFLSGAPSPAWDNDQLRELRKVKGADFEAVDVSSLFDAAGSGKARQR